MTLVTLSCSRSQACDITTTSVARASMLASSPPSASAAGAVTPAFQHVTGQSKIMSPWVMRDSPGTSWYQASLILFGLPPANDCQSGLAPRQGAQENSFRP